MTQKPEFHAPRRSEISEPLMQLAQQTLDGELSHDDFQLALESAFSSVETTFDDILIELEPNEDNDPDLIEYQWGLSDAVADVATLFQMGLREMAEWKPDENLAPLRVGRLLLEKAESEYLAIQRILERESLFADKKERQRQRKLWPELIQIADKVLSEESKLEDFVRAVSRVESSVCVHLEKTITEDMQTAFYLARKFDGNDKKVIELAEQKIIFSLLRLKEILGLWPK